jgi:hypothetical protein
MGLFIAVIAIDDWLAPQREKSSPLMVSLSLTPDQQDKQLHENQPTNQPTNQPLLSNSSGVIRHGTLWQPSKLRNIDQEG